jgi:ribosomal protein L44E
MANDTDQLVVAHLREIHAQLQGVSKKLEEHDRRFDRTDGGLDGFRPLVEHMLSLVTLSQSKVGRLEAHRDAAAAWQKRMDERLDEIERRLARVEEKLGI